MYLDTMQEIYANTTKILVDSRQGSNLLYLPLDKIMQMSAQPAGGINGAAATRAVLRRQHLQHQQYLQQTRQRTHIPGMHPAAVNATCARSPSEQAWIYFFFVAGTAGAGESTLFVVDQRQFGVVYALGQIKEVITNPA